MARVTVTSFTAARMLAIENSTVTGGRITNGTLQLTTRDGTVIAAGSVIGPKGDRGEAGGIWDATKDLKGAVKLAGNFGGTADVPKVTGELDANVDISYTKLSVPFTNPVTGVTSTLAVSAREMLGLAANGSVLAQTSVIKKGRVKVHWSGSEAEYLALPTAERNDPGFVAEII